MCSSGVKFQPTRQLGGLVSPQRVSTQRNTRAIVPESAWELLSEPAAKAPQKGAASRRTRPGPPATRHKDGVCAGGAAGHGLGSGIGGWPGHCTGGAAAGGVWGTRGELSACRAPPEQRCSSGQLSPSAVGYLNLRIQYIAGVVFLNLNSCSPEVIRNVKEVRCGALYASESLCRDNPKGSSLMYLK